MPALCGAWAARLTYLQGSMAECTRALATGFIAIAASPAYAEAQHAKTQATGSHLPDAASLRPSAQCGEQCELLAEVPLLQEASLWCAKRRSPNDGALQRKSGSRPASYAKPGVRRAHASSRVLPCTTSFVRVAPDGVRCERVGSTERLRACARTLLATAF